MQVYNELKFRLSDPEWYLDPELALLDTILDIYPEFIELIKEDILSLCKNTIFGRKDVPTVEQILRAAIYKELKGLTYEALAYATHDSKICNAFLKLDNKPFSKSVFQKYISVITAKTLEKIMILLNKIAIGENIENLEKVRPDTTVIETNIHYPTNNSLIWDCIKTSHRLLLKLKNLPIGKGLRNYTRQAKKHYFKINVTRGKDKRKPLFEKQLIILRKAINQGQRILSGLNAEKDALDERSKKLKDQLDVLLENMEIVFDISNRHEILDKQVPNEDKIVSIYEKHTDIIVKKKGECHFGHKVCLATGKSSLILHCAVPEGNPSDKDLFQPTLQKVVENYGKVPRDASSDGGFASIKNRDYAQELGVKNIVFNKIVGSMKNITTSKNMETRLKKWRSGIEAVISNLKRGFDLFRCNWKSKEHFDAKVFWSVIAYNLRVMSQFFMEKLHENLV